MPLAMVNENARRLHTRAMKIPERTQDVRLAMKRLLWLRGMTTLDLTIKTRMSRSFWKSRINNGNDVRYRIDPGTVSRFLDAIGATPAERARLHYLGALADGWKLENPREH